MSGQPLSSPSGQQRLDYVELNQFRNYREARVSFAGSLTAVIGRNGQGKTNLLEAIGYLASLRSFRGVSTEAMVNQGADRAVVRAEASHDGRELLLEAELSVTGRNRAQVNRQPLKRARDLLGVIRATVFTPDDLVLVKGGPSGRRDYLDDVLGSLHANYDRSRGEVERILRQRSALLKQSGSRLDAEAELTLDVFDAKLAEAGEHLANARAGLVAELNPHLVDAYTQVAGEQRDLALSYEPTWVSEGLEVALRRSRADDIRRGTTTVGPHRDEIEQTLNGLPARTHASQGEQRSFALAMRLAAHRVVTDRTETAPLLLLDDVFSELDAQRSAALLEALPAGQAILTTAGELPAGSSPELVLRVEAGEVFPA